MKRFMILAVVCAALAACGKTDIGGDPALPGDVSFKKGQKVTLSVGIDNGSDATETRSTTAQGDDFKWESGDKILVTVGGAAAEFTLKSGSGEASATFEGTMPESGDTFDVQYPVSAPSLSNQVYSVSDVIPHDMMLATASGCTINAPFTLTPQYAVLRLGVYGLSPVASIIVKTNESPGNVYVLNCMESGGTGIEPGRKNEPVPFFVMVRAGTYGFTAYVEHVNGTGFNFCPTTNDETIAGNTVYDSTPVGYPNTDESPVEIGGIVWAPVNCGYEPATGDIGGQSTGYPYGKLYQWGRKYGQGYNDMFSLFDDPDYPDKAYGNQFLVKINSPRSSHPDGSGYCGDFYCDTSWWIRNWYGGSDPDKLWNLNEGTGDSVSVSGYDPCPAGWRVPVKAELDTLRGCHTSFGLIDKNGVLGKCFYDSATAASGSVLFFPAAGYRDGNDSCNAVMRGEAGYYWSSSVRGVDDAWFFGFNNLASVSMDFCNRSDGYAVRCVQDVL